MTKILCECGRRYEDPIEAAECKIAGHPITPLTDDVNLVLANMTTVEILRATRAIISHRPVVPFQALLRQLSMRLESATSDLLSAQLEIEILKNSVKRL
jgi:hypothetical protein